MKKLLLATVATLALTASGYAAEPSDHGKAGAEVKGQAAGTQMKGKAAAGANTKDRAAGAEMKGHTQTTGAGASSEVNTKSEMKGSNGRAQKGAVKSRETTGAGADTEMKKSEPAPKANSNTIKGDNGVGQKGARSNEGGQKAGENASSGKAGGSVSLTAEQKTKIRTTVVAKGPKIERSKINFTLNVGTVVPRSSVHFVAVPATLIEIYPAWRGYDYFVVGDEIVIVDPRTLRIVAVIAV
jgi:hypothetical protein